MGREFLSGYPQFPKYSDVPLPLNRYKSYYIDLNSPEIQKGLESERNAAAAIALSPLVKSIRTTSRFSKDDINGYDIIVGLIPNVPKIKVVNVQVKSSRTGRISFEEKLKEKHGLHDDELGSWLSANKLIILNCQHPIENIGLRFNEQLQRIINYAHSPEPIDVYSAQ